MTDLRYPIGRMPVIEPPATAAERAARIDIIDALPVRLRAAVAGFAPEQWATPYRPGGWTVHQLVHHLADSHMNAYVRFKLALTEASPVIKAYDEAAWAELPDTPATPPEASLRLLEGLHQRWGALLRALGGDDFARDVTHPEHGRVFDMDQLLAQYAWHSEHHLRHITALAEREGW